MVTIELSKLVYGKHSDEPQRVIPVPSVPSTPEDPVLRTVISENDLQSQKSQNPNLNPPQNPFVSLSREPLVQVMFTRVGKSLK